MVNLTMKQWKKPLLAAAAAGAILIGPLNLFHAWTGVERYLISNFTITDANWPWYLPLQMACIGMGVLVLWVIFRMLVADRLLGAEKGRRIPDWITIILAIIMVSGGYFLSAALLGYEHQPTVFFTLYTASLLYVALYYSGHSVTAFLLVGYAGTFAEALLLAPSVGYYEFAHKELFGRAPSWLPFVYGWVGVYIHTVSREIGREEKVSLSAYL
ncbi:MAG: hypothetical protein KA369_22065 [Spirochaetes bacterium]|nr:hypothetical protein [Spirochaetota bacterium]